tara:strand:+ start:29 stop:325 length:297 start_codon:yes stop_codon:yes gene_type:complete
MPNTPPDSKAEQTIKVPTGDMKSLVIWALGKWGGGAAIAAVAMYGLSIVYQDMRKDRDHDRETRSQEISINSRTAEILENVVDTLENIEARLTALEGQ